MRVDGRLTRPAMHRCTPVRDAAYVSSRPHANAESVTSGCDDPQRSRLTRGKRPGPGHYAGDRNGQRDNGEVCDDGDQAPGDGGSPGTTELDPDREHCGRAMLGRAPERACAANVCTSLALCVARCSCRAASGPGSGRTGLGPFASIAGLSNSARLRNARADFGLSRFCRESE
jgi:hypothetical protein